MTGLSTHNPNVYATLGAYTLGGRIFEHHYTNDRDWKGTDNHFSLTPETLTELVEGLAEIRVALGSTEKFMEPVEESFTIERRKKMVAARDLPVGHVLTRNDINYKCPGDGIEPWQIDEVVERQVEVAIAAEEDIRWSALAR